MKMSGPRLRLLEKVIDRPSVEVRLFVSGRPVDEEPSCVPAGAIVKMSGPSPLLRASRARVLMKRWTFRSARRQVRSPLPHRW